MKIKDQEYKFCTACRRPYKYGGSMVTEWVLTDPDEIALGHGYAFCEECNEEFNQLVNVWLRYRTSKNETMKEKS